jgi:hypothetical protein
MIEGGGVVAEVTPLLLLLRGLKPLDPHIYRSVGTLEARVKEKRE